MQARKARKNMKARKKQRHAGTQARNLAHSFFFANAHNVYYSHKYNKTERKPTGFHQPDFCERLMSPL